MGVIKKNIFFWKDRNNIGDKFSVIMLIKHQTGGRLMSCEIRYISVDGWPKSVDIKDLSEEGRPFSPCSG